MNCGQAAIAACPFFVLPGATFSMRAGAKDGSNLRRGQRAPVESQLIDIALEVDVLAVHIPVGVMPAKPERLGNVQIRQGNILPFIVVLAHTIHEERSRLRRQPVHDARHMMPASVGNAGCGKGTASPASVRELQGRAALVNENQVAERLTPAFILDTGRSYGLPGANPQ